MKEKGETFCDLAESLPGVIYETDTKGVLTYVNKQGFNEFKHSEHIIGKLKVSDLVIPDDRKRARADFKRIIKEQDITLHEYQVLRGDGSTFTGLFHSKVIHIKNKPVGLRGVILDISKQKEAEKQLELHLHYEKIIGEIAFSSIWLADIKSFYHDCVQKLGSCLGKSGCYIWQYDQEHHYLNILSEWSASGVPSLHESLNLVDIIEEEWWAQAINQKRALIHKENKELFTRHANKRLHALGLKRLLVTPIFVEKRLFGFLGVSVFFKDCGLLIKDIELLKTAAGIISKTTESFQLQKNLIQSENHLRNLLQTIPHGVHEISLEGRIEYSNPAYQKLTGYTEKELIGKSILEILTDDTDGNQFKVYFQSLRWNQSYPTTWIGICRSKTGQNIYVQVDWNCRRNPKQEITGYIAVVTDITERFLAQKQNEKAQAYLEQQVRVRTKELSMANASLKSKQDTLLETKNKMAYLNRELLDANHALSVLAKNLDRNKETADREIALIISSKILPLVDNLHTAVDDQDHQNDLRTLQVYLQELIRPLKKDERIIEILSPAEMKIATMIKNGMTSASIAKALHVSDDTVKTHRRNIRRKLGLKNSQVNLKNYLSLKWDTIA